MTSELIRPETPHHAMLDFETLSLRTDAVLMCAGLVLFDDNFNVLAKARYDFALEQQTNRIIDPNTLRFWAKEPAFRSVLGDEDTTEPVYSAVHMLLVNMESAQSVWTNGSKDPEWLESIAKEHSRDFMLPKYYKFREFRTIRGIARLHGHVSLPIEHDYAKHDPVGDCLWQVAELKACYAHLNLSLDGSTGHDDAPKPKEWPEPEKNA